MNTLLANIKACRVCAQSLPLGANPVVRASTTARLLIIGQAPGTRVHETGIPWNDRSGVRLRSWLNLEKDIFYDETKIAIMPMGFCYPGVDKNGGDNPPRKECAPLWHSVLKQHMPHVKLTLLVGGYAQRYYLQQSCKATLHETVYAWHDYLPNFFPLPHPSWRNTAWLKRNPWFESKLLPSLRALVDCVLEESG